MKRRDTVQGLIAGLPALLFGSISLGRSGRVEAASQASDPRWQLSDAEWKRRLSPAAYAVLRKEATERPFSSPLEHEKRRGTFVCAGCRLALFSASTKYDSGTGWPSFTQPVEENVIAYHQDRSFGMTRVEVCCLVCDAHLGHVFPDGPEPTGLRYCINSASIRLVAD